jgi:hypothetical protein
LFARSKTTGSEEEGPQARASGDDVVRSDRYTLRKDHRLRKQVKPGSSDCSRVAEELEVEASDGDELDVDDGGPMRVVRSLIVRGCHCSRAMVDR